MNRYFFPLIATGTAIGLLVAGCETFSHLPTSMGGPSIGGSNMGGSTDRITPQQADSFIKTAAAVGKALEKFTPEQEYYLGRSVAATVLTQYQPFDKAKATDYLNLLGQTIALASDKPNTFAGYHFLILDSYEINAIAAPSGFILVTRGLLRCCRNEDELAAVLAHEISHVQLEHGIHAISSSRWKSAGMTAALAAGSTLGGQQLAAAVGAFEDCVHDVAGKILDSGYARAQEFAADKAATVILQRVGYNPGALTEVLKQLDCRIHPDDKHGFGKTHPPPQDRIKELSVTPLTTATPSPSAVSARAARFQAAMAGI